MAAAAPSTATAPSAIYRPAWLSEVWWVSAVPAEVSGVVTAAVPVPPAVAVASSVPPEAQKICSYMKMESGELFLFLRN